VIFDVHMWQSCDFDTFEFLRCLHCLLTMTTLPKIWSRAQMNMYSKIVYARARTHTYAATHTHTRIHSHNTHIYLTILTTYTVSILPKFNVKSRFVIFLHPLCSQNMSWLQTKAYKGKWNCMCACMCMKVYLCTMYAYLTESLNVNTYHNDTPW